MATVTPDATSTALSGPPTRAVGAGIGRGAGPGVRVRRGGGQLATDRSGPLVQPAGVQRAVPQRGLVHQVAQQRQVGLQPVDAALGQGLARPGQRLGQGARVVHDQLGQQAVVVR
jgi:hypothetical protein